MPMPDETCLASPDSATPARRWLGYVRRLAAGDEAAMTRLYDEAHALVFRQAIQVLREPADAEEVVLDTFMQAWRTACDYDPRRASVGTWLVMMARSRAIDRLRARSAATRHVEPIDDRLEPAAADRGPEETTRWALLTEDLRAALATLSPEARELIGLAYFGGLSHTQLAARLGQPLGTVKGRLRRATGALREALALAT